MSGYIWRCDLSKQYIKYRKEIDNAIHQVLSSGVYTLGSQVRAFENEFAGYIGKKYGVGVANGTDALVLALECAGVSQGDEVITTVYAPTPVPTAIILAGAKPVFVDVKEGTCLINPDLILEKVTERTRAILPVHLFGFICDMKSILKCAKGHGLTVIEDCAQAHGSSVDGRMAGTFADLAAFSFYPTKNLGAYGDGGMVLSNKKKYADRLKLLRNYGKKDNPFDSYIAGHNSRLDELEAAMLRVKLKYLDKMNTARRKLVALYKKELAGTPVVFFSEPEGQRLNYHVLNVLCDGYRDKLAAYLDKNGVQTNVYYPGPLNTMPAFKTFPGSKGVFPVSEKLSEESLALPLYPELECDTVAHISGLIRRFFGSAGATRI